MINPISGLLAAFAIGASVTHGARRRPRRIVRLSEVAVIPHSATQRPQGKRAKRRRRGKRGAR